MQSTRYPGPKSILSSEKPFPTPFAIAEVSQLDPVDSRLNASSNLSVLVLKPLVKVVRTDFCYVVNEAATEIVEGWKDGG